MYIDEEDKILFKKYAGKWLVEYDYEKNFDW